MEMQKGVTPMDEARVYQTSINRGRTVHVLSQEVKVHPWKIVMRLGLLKLAAEIQEAVNNGAISTAEGYELSRLGTLEDQIDAFQMVAAREIKGQRQVAKYVDGLVGHKSN